MDLMNLNDDLSSLQKDSKYDASSGSFRSSAPTYMDTSEMGSYKVSMETLSLPPYRMQVYSR